MQTHPSILNRSGGSGWNLRTQAQITATPCTVSKVCSTRMYSVFCAVARSRREMPSRAARRGTTNTPVRKKLTAQPARPAATVGAPHGIWRGSRQLGPSARNSREHAPPSDTDTARGRTNASVGLRARGILLRDCQHREQHAALEPDAPLRGCTPRVVAGLARFGAAAATTRSGCRSSRAGNCVLARSFGCQLSRFSSATARASTTHGASSRRSHAPLHCTRGSSAAAGAAKGIAPRAASAPQAAARRTPCGISLARDRGRVAAMIGARGSRCQQCPSVRPEKPRWSRGGPRLDAGPQARVSPPEPSTATVRASARGAAVQHLWAQQAMAVASITTARWPGVTARPCLAARSAASAATPPRSCAGEQPPLVVSRRASLGGAVLAAQLALLGRPSPVAARGLEAYIRTAKPQQPPEQIAAALLLAREELTQFGASQRLSACSCSAHRCFRPQRKC